MADDVKRKRMSALIKSIPYDPERYEFDDKFMPATNRDEIHTTEELVEFATKDPSIEIECKVLGFNENGTLKHKKISKDAFLEAFKKEDPRLTRFREGNDPFLSDGFEGGAGGGLVGNDFVPLLSGPFNKQQYFYDYLRGHAQSFFAYTHDPIAKRLVSITRQFVLGKGFRVEVICDDADLKIKANDILRAFEDAAGLAELGEYICTELSIYGEVMVWKLPNNESKIQYDLKPEAEAPKTIFPRYRLIDPSAIWEIVTYPEDITRVLYYQWVAPTQYQIYTGTDPKNGERVPTLKFIMQQVPADQVFHFKTNVVSNEKRGRSDLYPILGYLKRLRDSVNYAVIGMQKASAWAMDTTITGNDDDIAAYVQDQQNLGTIPAAGSEFVHTDKIKRDYLSNQHSSGGSSSQAFDWTLSMICAGYGVPTSYLGTHMSGGQTRASALVGTEPVAKVMEERQVLMGRIIKKIVLDMFKQFSCDVDVEVIFPEIITQDRSTKLKDLSLAQEMKWIAPQRAATMAAKELGVEEYEYDQEQSKISEEAPAEDAASPLTAPPDAEKPEQPEPPEKPVKPSALTSEDKRQVKSSLGY